MQAVQLKKRIISLISSDYPEISLVILYGSFAQNKETTLSDVDIAVAGPKTISTNQRIEMALHFSTELKREVDLLDLRQVHGVILKEILTKGKLLINKNPLLYAQIMKRYLFDQEDFMPLLERILKKRRERFIRGS